jgi:hypothetical protein
LDLRIRRAAGTSTQRERSRKIVSGKISLTSTGGIDTAIGGMTFISIRKTAMGFLSRLPAQYVTGAATATKIQKVGLRKAAMVRVSQTLRRSLKSASSMKRSAVDFAKANSGMLSPSTTISSLRSMIDTRFSLSPKLHYHWKWPDSVTP